MQILEKNLRNCEGEIKLIPETLDDLWHLKNIIEKGDIVYALTKRVSQSNDKLRSDKEVFTVKLGIQVEKLDFHRFTNRLRVTGKIVSGVEESGYHTINLVVGKEVSIIKKWKDEQLRRIEYAAEQSKRPEVLILTIEEGEATGGLLRQWGVEEVFCVRRGYCKESGERLNFFNEILDKLRNIDFKYLVLAGPGFTKRDFYDFLKSKLDLKNVVIVDTSSIGIRGYIEVLKRRVIDKILGEVRLAEEAEYIDKLLEEIAKDGKATYGIEEVKRAKMYGAIEVLLITDEYLNSEREKWDIDGFLRQIEQSGGKILILSAEFEPGRRLMSLGGIAALLRFSIG